ncbi:hypothetical protein CLIB1444_08S04324 [[Candida] jaroonii]|uniref:Uncharacterized protein n=1 Tax=[Candida] jaroonii TaxID=467808 RepID=A0ACA9YBT1_9ASCO|nr:hypothetical protein CLIB1444_08S04324 [[Candida] jaroonii]
MSKPSKKGKGKSNLERGREVDSVLSFNNFDYDYSNPRSTYLTLSIVLLPSILAIVIPVIPNSPSNNDIAVLVTDTLIVILMTFTVKYVIEWPWNWLRKIRSSKENILNNINSKYLIHNKDKSKFQSQLNGKIILIRRFIKYETIALGTGVFSHCLSSLLMIWTRNYIIVEETRKNIVFSDLNVGLFFIWGCFKILLVFLQKLKDASLAGEDEYNLINEWNLDEFYVLRVDEQDHVERTEVSREDPVQVPDPIKEQQSPMERKIDELMKLYEKMNEAKNNQMQTFLMSSTLKETRKRQHLPRDENQKRYHSIGSSLSTIFEDNELKQVQPRKPITLDYSLHGLPSKSRFRQIVTREESIKDISEVSDIPSDRFRELIEDVISTMKDIRDQYTMSDLFYQPIIIRKIFYNDVFPLILKIDNSSLKIFQKTIIIKTVIREIMDKHFVGNIRSLTSYMYSLLEKYLGSCKKIVKFLIFVNFEIPIRILIRTEYLILSIPKRAVSVLKYPFVKLSEEEFKAREFNLQPKFDKKKENQISAMKKLNQKWGSSVPRNLQDQ